MNAWDHLPNAKLIDQVLTSFRANPEIWWAAYEKVAKINDKIFNRHLETQDLVITLADSLHHNLWEMIRYQTMQVPCEAEPALKRIHHGVPSQYEVQILGINRWPSHTVRGTMASLVAYDDCAPYLDLSVDQLQMLYILNAHPACLLLQIAVQAFEMERANALVRG
jgi:hypothetical protein